MCERTNVIGKFTGSAQQALRVIHRVYTVSQDFENWQKAKAVCALAVQ